LQARSHYRRARAPRRTLALTSSYWETPRSVTTLLAHLRRLVRRGRAGGHEAGIRFEGRFRSWADAERASTGYDAREILQRTLHAALQVKAGEAAYERDGVLFSEVQYSYPLLAALLLATLSDRRLSVLDFGGALGTSYYQNRWLLRGARDLTWGVVEREDFASCGRKHFADGVLYFFSSVEECVREIKPNFVLLSGVLSYVPDPIALLGQLVGVAPPFICLDRTLVAVRGETRLTVQVVPPHIYDASYPCWIVKETELTAPFEGAYRRVYEFPALGGDVVLEGLAGAFKGYLFVRADTTIGVA
jgi:putative methyltransferase (TIGR04325 family)